MSIFKKESMHVAVQCTDPAGTGKCGSFGFRVKDGKFERLTPVFESVFVLLLYMNKRKITEITDANHN